MASSHSILPTSTANWHWKNKNVSSWAHTWFHDQLMTISLDDDGISVTNVSEVDGDAELGQRKSKLITIFDCKIVLDWQATAADGTLVTGSLTIPEVSHEVIVDKLSDYAYNWSLKTPVSPPVSQVYKLVQSKLPVALETKFAEFPVVLVETHGKDLTVLGSNDPSRSSTPAVASSSSSSIAPSSSPAPVKKTEQPVKAIPINTASVSVEANFMASADDLFNLLTDERRIPTWSRSAAQSTPKPDAEYSLFGGGVKGRYVSLTPGKEIVQTWSLSSPTWPTGHIATLTTTFNQGSDSTTMALKLDGVPTGMEDEIKQNLEGYYIHGLKSIGYVQVAYNYSSSPPPKPRTTKQSPPKPSTTNIAVVMLFTTLVVAVVALGVPFFASRPPNPS